MLDKAQVIAQLRFAMEQLSERNAQHEWEHLSRHLARERICGNILPATGPVQAGGDQGRDFETFRTYLQRSTLKARSFVGLVSDKPIAFACTLQKSPASKVRHDVTTITSSGISVDCIYVFCSRDVSVAKRHELQDWCYATYKTTLEILDGAAIAELLCDQDVFWIAVRYLQMPSDMLPTPSGDIDNSWYRRRLEKWRQTTWSAQTFADFVEIRAAARYARGELRFLDDGTPINNYDRPELPFWIDRLDELAAIEGLPLLSRRAFYEVSVLRLRSFGSLHGEEPRLRAYFAAIPEMVDTDELENADVLLNYLVAAQRKGEVVLDKPDLNTWAKALAEHVDMRIHQAKKNDRKNEWCALLEIQGHIALHDQCRDVKYNVTAALQVWSKLAKIAADAPLFPLERFANRLANYAAYMGADSEYESLTQAIDALTIKRFGRFQVAANALERATKLYDAGNLSLAMAQLHGAKIDWFAEETLHKSLSAMRMLSRAYIEQGLFFAAKYYATAASYLVLQSPALELKHEIARAIAEAASCDYAMGAWHGFLELSEVGAMFYPHFAKDPTAEFNEGGVLHNFAVHIGMMIVITKMLQPELEQNIRDRCVRVLHRLGLDDQFIDVEDVWTKNWNDKGEDQLWKAVTDQMSGWPWSDSGDHHYAQWSAHGVTWYVQWANDYETTLVAEEFLAGFQVFLSDLAGYDLCLLRASLHITLTTRVFDEATDHATRRNLGRFRIKFETSSERRAIIELPSYCETGERAVSYADMLPDMLGVACSLLEEVSLLPSKRLRDILHERFRKGLSHKLFIAAPYSQCIGAFVDKEAFTKSSRASYSNPSVTKSFSPRTSIHLPWYTGPGPGYNAEEAHKMIQRRYERAVLPIQLTLKRLAESPEFQATVNNLRNDGWKDWHIISIICNLTMNYRMNESQLFRLAAKKGWQTVDKMLQQPESEDSIVVPMSEYSERNVRQHMPMFMATCVKTFGLEHHQSLLDVPLLEDFLVQRYSFWSDDIPHEDPFQG